MKTAIEHLEQELERLGVHLFDEVQEAIEQAKAMEKEQIMDAFVECWKANVPDGIECKLDAQQYYNENFKSE